MIRPHAKDLRAHVPGVVRAAISEPDGGARARLPGAPAARPKIAMDGTAAGRALRIRALLQAEPV